MPGKMDVALETRENGVAVAHFRGRLDFGTAADARACFAQAIAGGHAKIIVDLSDVDFVDSSGLGALISGMRTTRQAGGDLHIARPNEQVTMLLSLTSLDQVLTTRATIDEAIDGFPT